MKIIILFFFALQSFNSEFEMERPRPSSPISIPVENRYEKGFEFDEVDTVLKMYKSLCKPEFDIKKYDLNTFPFNFYVIITIRR